MNDVDVLIVGAGISGIDAAVNLQKSCPDRRFVMLEAREQIGGTWDLFRYPGIRSDSDMFTLGFNFKPWNRDESIAKGETIRDYLEETIDEFGLRKHLRLQHRVTAADWDSATATWRVSVSTPAGDQSFSCNFLLMCSGYYSYAGGYTPDFPGRDSFRGDVIHPQKWPENLDYSNKKIVVIGSGATAVTLVPSLAQKAARVTMLQRTPTWMISRPGTDRFAILLRKFLPEKTVYRFIRWRNMAMSRLLFKRSRSHPEKVSDMLLKGVRQALTKDVDIDRHFKPNYTPWDQRLCLVPDNDFFDAINTGAAEVVTDHIAQFDESGIQLASGQHLDADIIVTATGLELEFMSGIPVTVDQQAVNFGNTYCYKGFMVSGVPNIGFVFGYANASWTLRADLVCEYLCRLLNHMRRKNVDTVLPTPLNPNMVGKPMMELKSGYVARAIGQFPKQGDRMPWQAVQDYPTERDLFQKGELDNELTLLSSRENSANAA